MPLRAKGDMAYRAGSMTQLISLPPRASEPDPIRAVLAIVAVFAVLVFWRLGTPSKIMFDEVHYLPLRGT
jgi:dolichyl-phosphate-mannose--protein O-mannosyl transferase